MYKPEGYDDAKPKTGNFKKVPPGAYILGIVTAVERTSRNGHRMLELALDIAEGEFRGYYSNLSSRFDKNCRLKHYRVLDNDQAAEYLKGDIQAIEHSNTGYTFNFDEQTLVGKKVGGMLAEEEYYGGGDIKTAIKIRYLCTIEDVRSGLLKVPEKKKVVESFGDSGPADFNDDDLPF